MSDRRALILDRLEALLANLPDAPADTVYRNRGAMPVDKRPCIVLLDGSEEVHQSMEGRAGRVFAHSSPSVMILKPQIFALLKARELAKTDEYATELTTYRNAILVAVTSDQDLLTITGDNGDIAYRGHQTDMQNGMLMQGELQMDFAFYYVLDPRNL